MEILVVIAIIAVLLTIGVGAMMFARTHAKKQSTVATMKIAMNAIDAFYEENNQTYPDPDHPGGTPPSNQRLYRYSLSTCKGMWINNCN